MYLRHSTNNALWRWRCEMDKFDAVFQQLGELKQDYSEISELRSQIQALKSENKALKESIRILSRKRREDRLIIEKWQAKLRKYSIPTEKKSTATIVKSEPSSEPQSDETRLSSSPPRTQRSAGGQSNRGITVRTKSSESRSQNNDENVDLVYSVKMEPSSQYPQEFAEPQPPSSQVNSQIRSSQTTEEPYVKLSSLLQRDWHPSEFIVNPEFNKDGENYAFHSKVLGKEKRACLHGRGCQSCENFYKLTGYAVQSSKNLPASRHRELWSKQETPPGFWRSDFANTAQESLEQKQMAEQTSREGLKRLHEAVASGQFLFRDLELREAAKNKFIR